MRFAEDAVNVVKAVVAEIDRRFAASHRSSTSMICRVSERQGQGARGCRQGAARRGFSDLPDCSLSPRKATKSTMRSRPAAPATCSSSSPIRPIRSYAVDFPVDTWLYGVARVREKMHAWEQMVMFAGGFASRSRRWRRCSFRSFPMTAGSRSISRRSKARHRPIALHGALCGTLQQGARQCGLLLDEWTEIIPAENADTGITFHYDRPNYEAPQAMLLVTPSEFRGAWQWDDLVDAINETLDFAKRRAIEPKHIDQLPYAPFLPATIMATQVRS